MSDHLPGFLQEVQLFIDFTDKMFIVSGAYQCFRQDQRRLTEHSCTPGNSEASYKDLLLVVKLEVRAC